MFRCLNVQRICLAGVFGLFLLYFVLHYKILTREDERELIMNAFVRKVREMEVDYRVNMHNLYKRQSNMEEYITNSNNDNNTDQCIFNFKRTPKNDIQLLDVYENLPFTKSDGLLWEKGWKIEYNPNRFHDGYKLKVFVVPHSHNDPGWLKTFDEYYEQKTKGILTNAVHHLTENPELKFIWAEICYFSRFYDNLHSLMKERIKNLLRNRQLEFVTGGWVMPDEANSHWLSVLIQLTEGLTWLKQNLNVTPTSSWAIDPFGHSPTMPYILQQSGFKNLLIQRTHYSVKYNLGNRRLLEFRWRQLWDNKGVTELFTHMMPFISYGIRHTCGPERNVCDQFDFRYINEGFMDRLLNSGQDAITERNIAEKSKLLVDQWKKKAELYHTNALLVPLGDDFRFRTNSEWTHQRENYEKLFYYINRQNNFHVEAKFATLEEYFDAVHQNKIDDFPTLSGDFFTYADREDHYWSGYYTTRPYYKRMDRLLLHYVRAAEMLSVWRVWPTDSPFEKLLQSARRELSLFQHHDGITGTARERVVEDYASRLNKAISACRFVMQQSVYRLLTQPTAYKADYSATYFHMDDSNWPSVDQKRKPILLNEQEFKTKYVVFHNSLPQWREDIVDFQVSTSYVEVTDYDGNPLPAQINPVWTWENSKPICSTQIYRLLFKVKIPPMGLKTYIINLKSVETIRNFTTMATNIISGTNEYKIDLQHYSKHKIIFSPHRSYMLTMSNGVVLHFNNVGVLKSIQIDKSTEHVPVEIQFLTYGTRFFNERSGAYLFLPNGSGKPIVGREMPVVLFIEGPLETSISVGFPILLHQTILRGDKIEIRNTVNMDNFDNVELSMRISTTIQSNNTFYTDLNGLQMIKRQRLSKLPLQANFYPVPTAAYIEDDTLRLTLVSAQPLGGTSLAQGELEIMLDRRLKQSDGRGLGEGVLDNVPIQHIFNLLLEKINKCHKPAKRHPSGALTLSAYRASQEILNPVDKFIYVQHKTLMLEEFGSKHKALADDTEIVALRNLPSPQKRSRLIRTGVIVHRTKLLECSSHYENTCTFSKPHVLPLSEQASSIESTTLTFLQTLNEIVEPDIALCPMDTRAYIVNRNTT